MKRLFKNVLLVLFLALGFMLANTNVYAESLDTSKWNTDAIEKLTTSLDSDDIIPDFTGVKINKRNASIGGTIVLNITIPEDYDQETIVIAPDVFQRLTKLIYEDETIEWLEDDEYLRFMNSFQASDKIRVKLVITNLSKFDYYYEETSFEIFPTEPLVYQGRETTTGDGEKKLFNGMELPTEGFIFHRAYNTALKALLPDMNSSSMTDEKIDAALKAKGYTGINDYGKYLLEFYNTKYNTNYSRLDQFSKGIIREMLSDLDPVYLYNSAYGKLLDMPSYKFPINQKEAKKKILAALVNTEFENNPIGYLLDYYNKAYNTNAKNLSELCDEAINDLYANAGSEFGGYYNLETNKDVLVLAYNYFYNEGLSFYFDQKDKNGNYTDNKDMSNSDREGESYSIGSYMRDEKKGDEEILERAGTLKSNSESVISGVLKNIGNYTPNAYLNFNFMVNLQLKYRAKTGNLIIRYVDREGNELLSDVTSTEMVGKNYQTNPEDILNYELVDIDGVELGEYIDGTIIVTYIYDKVGSEETGEITPPNTGVSTTNSGLLILSLLVVNALGASVVLRKNN